MRGDQQGQGIGSPPAFAHVIVIKRDDFSDRAQPFFPRLHPGRRRRRASARREKKQRSNHRVLTCWTRRSRSSICAWLIFSIASAIEKNSARSISGNSCVRPERGGHSIAKVFEATTKSAGKFPSNAQACTVLPPFFFTAPNSIGSETLGLIPISSSNSIRARLR